MKNKKTGRKTPYVLLACLMIIVLIRMALPLAIRHYANKEINKINPKLSGDVSDVNVSFLNRNISLVNIKLYEADSKEPFLDVGNLQFSFFVKNFLERIVGINIILTNLNISVSNSNIKIAKEILQEFKKRQAQKTKEEKGKVKKHVVLIGPSTFQLANGNVQFMEFPGIRPERHLKISDVSLVLKNLLPDKEQKFSSIDMNASIDQEGKIKTFGKINLTKKPYNWEIDSNLTSFYLPHINPMLKEKVPITFTKGEMEVYAEAVSEDGKVKGYVKPYLKDIDVVKNKEKFIGPKHWGIEIITAITNLILRNPETKTVATKIPFEFDKKLKIDTGKALDKALQNAFEKKLKPELENSLKLK